MRIVIVAIVGMIVVIHGFCAERVRKCNLRKIVSSPPEKENKEGKLAFCECGRSRDTRKPASDETNRAKISVI